jgi:hypothetical protein
VEQSQGAEGSFTGIGCERSYLRREGEAIVCDDSVSKAVAVVVQI